MNKIKAFFQNKWTRLVLWILLALIAIGLMIGGATTEIVNSAVVLVGGIVEAFLLLGAFICEQIKK